MRISLASWIIGLFYSAAGMILARLIPQFEGIYIDFFGTTHLPQLLTRVILSISPNAWMLGLFLCGFFVVLKDRWLKNRTTLNVILFAALVLLIGIVMWGLFLPMSGANSIISG
jgi:predicted branched-subunit amino acid permease